MKLLVSSSTEHLLEKSKEFSSDAILVNEKNYLTTVVLDGVGYTSTIEFKNKDKFLQALELSSEVIYILDPNIKTLNSNNPSLLDKEFTELLLYRINQTKKIIGIDTIITPDVILDNIKKISQLADKRSGNRSTLWAVGCSYTFGVGVDDHQRWGHILGTLINFPVSFLAARGASISWAADQILRSDIKKDDIIVWGITTLNRFPYYDSERGVTHNNTRQHNLNVVLLMINDDYMYYQSITHILQVINFCNKIGCKLLLVGLLSSERDLLYYKNFPNYYHRHNPNSSKNNLIDLGTDNSHPGPKQHQAYADAIYNQLKIRGWVS